MIATPLNELWKYAQSKQNDYGSFTPILDPTSDDENDKLIVDVPIEAITLESTYVETDLCQTPSENPKSNANGWTKRKATPIAMENPNKATEGTSSCYDFEDDDTEPAPKKKRRILGLKRKKPELWPRIKYQKDQTNNQVEQTQKKYTVRIKKPVSCDSTTIFYSKPPINSTGTNNYATDSANGTLISIKRPTQKNPAPKKREPRKLYNKIEADKAIEMGVQPNDDRKKKSAIPKKTEIIEFLSPNCTEPVGNDPLEHRNQILANMQKINENVANFSDSNERVSFSYKWAVESEKVWGTSKTMEKVERNSTITNQVNIIN